MRILAAADLHGVIPVYEWLVANSRSADVLILAGDIFDADFEEGQREQAKNILEILGRSRIPVLYIMGNDDNIPLGRQDELIKPVHGTRIEIGDYNFVGYQYTPPFVGESFVKTDDEIEQDLVSFESLVDKRTVLVTHTPAYGSFDSVRDRHVGSTALADFLHRHPVLAHIHGHIHHSFGVDGYHFNVASAAQCRAMLIDLPSLNYDVLRKDSR